MMHLIDHFTLKQHCKVVYYCIVLASCKYSNKTQSDLCSSCYRTVMLLC